MAELLDSNLTRLFQRWWNFVDTKSVELTEWQSEVAVAYLTGERIHVQIHKGAGQTFIHNLLLEFVLKYDHHNEGGKRR